MKETLKKDIAELKRRFKPELCTIDRIAGAYVDAEKNKIATFNENFMNLDDTEIHKYLDIIKCVYSKNIGENILTLEFNPADNGQQDFLQRIVFSHMRDEAQIEELIDSIIYEYDHMGNYLILLFHDAYDVMTKTSDNAELDESEEVYEYIQCIICPVSLEKGGLEYNEQENRITPIVRDWIVGKPDTAFIYPAFEDRSANREHVIFYTKDTLYPHRELMTEVLGCLEENTYTQVLDWLDGVIDTLSDSTEKKEKTLQVISAVVNSKDIAVLGQETIMTKEMLSEIMQQSGIPENENRHIVNSFERRFKGRYPTLQAFLDKKRVEQYFAVQKKQKIKTLLAKASRELLAHGPSETADEIERIIENMR